MTALRQHRHTVALFVLLSLADLTLTTYLLQRSGGEVYEANWLAKEVLVHWGLAGLAAFKCLLVLLTGALVMVVAAYRPTAARRLTKFACTAVGIVVLYSLGLLVHLEGQARAEGYKDLRTIQQESRELARLRRAGGSFSNLLERLSEALAAGHCTLPQAVAQLGSSDRVRDPMALARFRQILAARSDEECLAAMVVHGALVALTVDGSPAARTRADALLAAYRADYGSAMIPYLLADLDAFKERTGEGSPVAVVRTKADSQPSVVTGEAGRPRFDPQRASRMGPRPGFGGRPPRRPAGPADQRLPSPPRPSA